MTPLSSPALFSVNVLLVMINVKILIINMTPALDALFLINILLVILNAGSESAQMTPAMAGS